jgi:DNA-binding XRE family transcriptional regulator
MFRTELSKTQKEMAHLLGVSLTAIRSYEQGWRSVSVHVERQLLFLIAKRRKIEFRQEPCWVVKRCPKDVRGNCPAWEFRVGQLCWFINGTICKGEVQNSWTKKMRLCRKCVMLRSLVQPIVAR